MLDALEKRWKAYEQPFYLLKYEHFQDFRTMWSELMNAGKIKNWMLVGFLVLYAVKHLPVSINVVQLTDQATAFLRGNYDTVLLETLSPFHFCSALQLQTPILSRLAYFLLTSTIQSASCERLFSIYGRTQTKERNRLKHENVGDLTLVAHFSNEITEKRRKPARIMSSAEYALIRDLSDSEAVLTSGKEFPMQLQLETEKDKCESSATRAPTESVYSTPSTTLGDEENADELFPEEIDDDWLAGLDQTLPPTV